MENRIGALHGSAMFSQASTRILVTVVLLITGCERGKTTDPEPTATSSSPAVAASSTPIPVETPKKPLNVILLVVDAMRYDMPWEGYDRAIAHLRPRAWVVY